MGWPYQQKPPMGWPLDYDSGLVPEAGFWLFNEDSGNKVYDLSGNGNIGTITSPVWVPGKFGSCLSFDGSGSSLIQVPDADVLDIRDGSYTFSIWINVNVFVSGGAVINKRNGAGNGYYQLKCYKDGDDVGWQFLVYDGSNLRVISPHSLTEYLTGVWYHIVCVYDVSNSISGMKFYINNVVKGTDATSAANINNTKFLGFGSYDTTYYNGLMDIPQFWNRALSASEIALLYREPFCMFKDPAEVALLGGYQAVPTGMAGAMTTNTGYWGW